MPRPRFLAISLTAAIALSAAGCGGDDEGFRNDGSKIDGDPSTSLPADLASTKSSIKQRAEGEPLPAAQGIGQISTDLSKKPAVPKPTGAEPKELQGTDVVQGKGDEVKTGDTVSVRYVGVLYKNGKEFDSSWKNGKKTFDFTVGKSQVIQGWDQGVPGMKVGGRRVLSVPAELAYGATGSPPTIPANSALVFVVDLTKIQKG